MSILIFGTDKQTNKAVDVICDIIERKYLADNTFCVSFDETLDGEPDKFIEVDFWHAFTGSYLDVDGRFEAGMVRALKNKTGLEVRRG